MSETSTEPTLFGLASIFNEWIAPAPGVDAVYLFGSRVRGDNRPDSDVDVRLYRERWGGDDATAKWWTEQNDEDFRALKARLPGRLEIHADPYGQDAADLFIRHCAEKALLVVGRVICIATPSTR